MKIAAANNDITRSGVIGSGEFKIKATAKAFAILSGGLYSDKIKAVIRELSCNAYDAHKAAGKENVPFEIKMPTRFEPTFYVKDFGIGLSEEDVFNLYTTYFDSTKADSNDYIGALGLGSKSPFSYTNSFTVESRFNGRKYIFNAFLNEKGLPEIAKLAEEATDETNGLTVMFSARAEDVEHFRTKARTALMYFDPQPKLVGWGDYSRLTVKTLFEGKNWKLVERSSADYYTRNDGPAVKQGPVIYPIDSQLLRREKLSKKLEQLVDLSIDIEVPVGHVDVAASREALSYDKRTIANLLAVFEQVADEFETTVSKAISGAKTMWDARLKLAEFIQGRDAYARTISAMIKSGSIKPEWNGQKVEIDFTVDVAKLKNVSVNTLARRYYAKRLAVVRSSEAMSDKGKKYIIETTKHTSVIVMDMKKNAGNDVISQHLMQIAAKNPNAENVTVIVLVPNDPKHTARARVDAATLCADMGGASWQLASALPYQPSKKAYQYKARAKNQVWEWSGFSEKKYGRRNVQNTTYSKLTWNTVDVDFADGGFYVLVERFQPVHNKKPIVRMDQIVDMMKALDIKMKFVAMNEKQLAAAQKEGDWEEFIPALIKEVKAKNAKNEITNTFAANSIKQAMGRVVEHLNTWKLAIDNGSFNNDLSTFLMELRDACQSKYAHAINNIAYGLRELGLYDDAEIVKQTKVFSDGWKDVRSTYPMLALLDFNHAIATPSQMTTVLKYVDSQ